MKYLRTAFCAFSVVASLVALMHHLGFDLWGCATCSFVDDVPLSGALAWGGPFVLTGLAYALYLDAAWSKILLGVAGIGSLALVGWMIRNHLICNVCVLVHTGVLSAVLALIPKPRFLGLLFFSVAIAFSVTGGWDRFEGESGVAIFRPRDRETIPDGRVYVLFTDPECSRCQLLEAAIDRKTGHPPVLYRWALLPHNMYRSIRVAACLETARIEGGEAYDQMRRELIKSSPPLNDAVLTAAANKAGLKDKIRAWLETPSDRALIAISEDQTTVQELNIKSLPALAELSPPDASGTRTLRLVPVSALGVP